MRPGICLAIATMTIALPGCGERSTDDTAVVASAVVAVQSLSARALRLPRLRPQPSRAALVTDRPVSVRVRVVLAGDAPADTTIQARSFGAGCGESFVDTAVVRNGNAVVDAIVWVEGVAALRTAGVTEHRPTVQLEGCRLRPRVQLAAPGSTLMLVMRDSLAESLVIVPSSASVMEDTVPFTMDGQLIPVQRLADSAGVLAVFATGLPWARAFVGIAPPGASALSDAAGTALFTVDGRAGEASFHAWHPSLGLAEATVALSASTSAYEVTLTFKRSRRSVP